ncbi:hypothetical protein ACHAXM_006230 [Skeletonema potamos]|jgi:hypothetical protein
MLSARKRKAVSSAIEPPRFMSFRMATITVPIASAPSQPIRSLPFRDDGHNANGEASFSSLPYELFCNVVSYLGPTSSSLCALHQVDRDHHVKLTTIGNIMLQRARLRFRTPLPPLSIFESSVSLFVRHARAAKIVHDACEILALTLKKHFPVINPDTAEEDTKKPSCLEAIADIDQDSVKPNEVNHALNTALCLLGAGKRHYFEDDPQRADDISESAATTALEMRVYSLCSRLGAKAYKYAKSRMCQRYDHEDYLFSPNYAAVTDEMPLEDFSDEEDCEDDDISIDPSEIEIDQDVSLLEKASMVLQLVVLQDAHGAGKHISQDRFLSGSK